MDNYRKKPRLILVKCVCEREVKEIYDKNKKIFTFIHKLLLRVWSIIFYCTNNLFILWVLHVKQLECLFHGVTGWTITKHYVSSIYKDYAWAFPEIYLLPKTREERDIHLTYIINSFSRYAYEKCSMKYGKENYYF